MANEFEEIYFKKPLTHKQSLFVFLLLSYRKGNKILVSRGKVIGAIVHKDDLESLMKLINKKGR